MRDLDVVVQRTNGSYRAVILALPNVAAEGESREEALTKVRQAVEDFLATADVTTISVNLPAQISVSRSPRVWLESAGMFKGDEAAMLQHIEEIEAERKRELEAMELADKLRQRDAVKRELEIVAALNEPTTMLPPGSPKAVLRTIAACRIDPNDKLYQQYVTALEAEEQRQWEEFERENAEAV
ncbi:MAG: hypothetical protein HY011_28085 [Acidobacteria bacterium]|nr:hypothetical protein [Acidobacteriota bacterium]